MNELNREIFEASEDAVFLFDACVRAVCATQCVIDAADTPDAEIAEAKRIFDRFCERVMNLPREEKGSVPEGKRGDSLLKPLVEKAIVAAGNLTRLN